MKFSQLDRYRCFHPAWCRNPVAAPQRAWQPFGRAEAEVAYIRLSNAHKEAHLQAQLHVLKMERAAAAAWAEAETLEAAVESRRQSCWGTDIQAHSCNLVQQTRGNAQMSDTEKMAWKQDAYIWSTLRTYDR